MEFQCIQCNKVVHPKKRYIFFNHNLLCDECWWLSLPKYKRRKLKKTKPVVEQKTPPKQKSLTTIRSYLREEAREMVPDKVCQECGAARECVHHIIPLYKGGKNELSNLVALCKACHRKKHPNLPSFMFY